MRKVLLAAAMAATAIASSAVRADVGVSVSVGQPGFYGQIDIGDFPQPPVLYPQPVLIYKGPVDRPPVYLRVPSGHAKHWKKHCREYNACGERVFFVQEGWYEREYVPRYKKHLRDRKDSGRSEHKKEGRGNSNKERKEKEGKDNDDKGRVRDN